MWEDDDLDSVLANTMGVLAHSLYHAQSAQPLSRLEVDDKFVTVIFDLPGTQRDEVTVTCTDEAISVEAVVRRKTRSEEGAVTESYTRYSKEILLPVRVVSEKGTARFKNGMIVVKIPRHHDKGLRETGKKLRLRA